jgi:hypothetical protein
VILADLNKQYSVTSRYAKLSIISTKLLHAEGKGKVSPKQAYVALRGGGVQEVKAPGFLDNQHIKVVRLSALRTGRLYSQEYPGTHFERLRQPWAHGLIGHLRKNPQ